MLSKEWTSKSDFEGGTLANLLVPEGMNRLELKRKSLSGTGVWVFDAGACRKFNWQSFQYSKEDTKIVLRDDFRENSLSEYYLEALANPWNAYTAPSYDSSNKRININTGDDRGTFLRPKNISIQNFVLSHNFRISTCYPSNAPVYPCGRWVNQSNMYFCCIDHGCPTLIGSPRISKLVSDDVTDLSIGSTYYSLNTTYQIKLTINGNSIVIEVPGLASRSASDGQFPNAGGVKFGVWQGAGWIDNFLLEHYSLPSPSGTSASFKFWASSNGTSWSSECTDIARVPSSRFIKIEVTMTRQSLAKAMPVLKDMTLTYKLLVQPIFI